MASAGHVAGDVASAAFNSDYTGLTQDVASATVGKIPGVGSTLAGAAEGAAEGALIAGTASTAVGVGTALAAGAAAAAGSAAAAGTAIGVGAAIGNAIPIPGIGAAIGAVIGALVAAGNAIAGATKDTFHPSPADAAAWLVLIHIDPGAMWASTSGETLDKALSANDFARLVRYLRVVAGFVKPGEKGNNGNLYNPVSNNSCDNPYMCQVDPADPLTDPAFITKLQAQIKPNTAAGQDLIKKGILPPPTVQTPEAAKAVLALLRSQPSAFLNLVTTWGQFNQQVIDQIGGEIRQLRLVAGEDGPDPVLSPIFHDVSVHQVPGKHYVIGQGFVEDAVSTGYGWWVVGGIAVLAVTAGTALVLKSRGVPLSLSSVRETFHLNAAKELSLSPGAETFLRVLNEGVSDGELEYEQAGLGSMFPFHKVFGDARVVGISPTELAVSGRYFGRDIEPIRINVYANGRVVMPDGRKRYLAAKMAGAHAILADVVEYDGDGDIVTERRAPVGLL